MKILILDAHPDPESLCASLAKKYFEGTKLTAHEAEIVHLRDLEFSPILSFGYRKRNELEQSLIRQQELITWCNHFVLVTPVWWMGTPALLKGYFDRILLPKFAFKYHKKDPFWDRLLSGRSARVIYTQDAPQLYQLVARWDCFWKSINHGTLGFCGFKPVRRTVFSQVKNANEKKRQSWLQKVYTLGQLGK